MRSDLAPKRRKALSEAIASAKGAKGTLDLLVMAAERREEVARQLERIGKVRHYYSFVPYISLTCDADYADILRKAASGRVSDSVFEKSFRSIVPAISSVELSNRLAIPKISVSERKTATRLWNLEAIGAYEAQQRATGEGVNVAVIDTGVEYSHPQLAARFNGKKGHDFVNNTDDPMDENGHGTHVAGIIGAEDYGVAPGCSLYAVRVLDGNGSGTEADAIAGIEWCIANNVDVANMSFGSPVASSAFERVCGVAAERGMLMVAAAGNSGYGPNYPAAFGDSVIAVAAVDESLKRAEFSNIWETNDIAAPGVNITSTYIGGRYATMSGTSMSAPEVTGGLADAKSAGGESSELEELMKEHAQPCGQPEEVGAGMVRVDRLAAAVMEGSQKYLPQLMKRYAALESAADRALTGFAKDAMAELRRLVS